MRNTSHGKCETLDLVREVIIRSALMWETEHTSIFYGSITVKLPTNGTVVVVKSFVLAAF